ncbi:hypothetical protein LUZ60_015725 [Juncus effusus]|nr:hypothetical protein LUZ60_015725 [Juncus effusus]
MAVPDVDKILLGELESMGFPTNRATRALHFSGNSSLNDAINWAIEHENDSDIDQIPLVSVNIEIKNGDSFSVPEEVKLKTQQLREHANGTSKKLEENRKVEPEVEKEITQAFSEANLEEKRKEENERERILGKLRTKKEEERRARDMQLKEDEKERIRTNKEKMEAKRNLEENQRKRSLAQAELEEEQDKRARERIRRRIEDDKVERKRKFGLPNQNMETVKSAIPDLEKKKEVQKPSINLEEMRECLSSLKQNHKKEVQKPSQIPEEMRECLRSLKQNHKDENAKVKRAFQTLLKIVGNVAKTPNEDKYRRIRLSNPTFKEKVGNFKGGIEFLEICGFEKMKIGDEFYLLMPRDKVDIKVLNLAGVELNSAMSNPYFGLFSNLKKL